jgi:aerobic carbon-monoxide dehydrogenase small subunit
MTNSEYKISFVLNNKPEEAVVGPGELLVDVLRERFRLTGTKIGCGIGECGACTVLVDGKPVNSCLVFAITVDGKEVITVEGLGQEKLHLLQEAFISEGAVQCGYCTPGMLLSAKALLDKNVRPSEDEIKRAISGNICRCTGYQRIVAAIRKAAGKMRGAGRGEQTGVNHGRG